MSFCLPYGQYVRNETNCAEMQEFCRLVFFLTIKEVVKGSRKAMEYLFIFMSFMTVGNY